MRIGFVSPPVSGHLNPMTTLARKLQARGHEVSLISTRDAEPFVRAAHLDFIPVSEQEFPVESLAEEERRFSKLQGEEGLKFTYQSNACIVASLFKHLPGVLVAESIDAVVLDPYHPYLGLIPMSLYMPYVHVANAVHFDISGRTPLCFYDWPYENSALARARNLEGVELYRQLLGYALPAAKVFADEAGLSIDWSDLAATISKLAWLTQTPRAFDFDDSVWPPNFHHTGPWHDGAGRPEIEFPWERINGDTLVYASMGTLQNGLEHVFHSILRVAGHRKDLQFVVSAGHALDLALLDPCPSNVILVRKAPQLKLLKRASLCITHAGLNTVLESLTQGVPLVAISVTNDQPGVAARIADKKVGAFVPLAGLTVPRLTALVDEVMGNCSYRENAHNMQRAIANADGLSKAAELIEKVFRQTTNQIGEMALRC